MSDVDGGIERRFLLTKFPARKADACGFHEDNVWQLWFANGIEWKII